RGTGLGSETLSAGAVRAGASARAVGDNASLPALAWGDCPRMRDIPPSYRARAEKEGISMTPDTKGCIDGHSFTGTTSYACHVEGRPCEVVELFAGRLRDAEAIAAVDDELPCHRCRAAERDVSALAGIRLGKHERRVLLAAPPADGKNAIIPPAGEG